MFDECMAALYMKGTTATSSCSRQLFYNSISDDDDGATDYFWDRQTDNKTGETGNNNISQITSRP
jgi:hypothetical protein